MQANSSHATDMVEFAGKEPIMTQVFNTFPTLSDPRGLMQYPEDLDHSFEADIGKEHSQ